MTQPSESKHEEWVAPYCGGCGHRFFEEPKISPDEAKKEAEKRRCHYCLDDERDGRSKR